MSWDPQRARKRVNAFREQIPETSIAVEGFASYVQRRSAAKAKGELIAERAGQISIPRNRAIETHGVHVYANLIDFNSVLEDETMETEARHRRALEFLNAHYSACDVLIDQFGIQRVDFHSGRLHAVVLEPEGQGREAERLSIAIAFAAAFRRLVVQLGGRYPEFTTKVRIGIDSGPAIAINDGKSDEAEPLFIGSPANKAAKLAAGDEEGIYFSDRAELARENGSLLNTGMALNLLVEEEALTKFYDNFLGGSQASAELGRAFSLVDERVQRMRQPEATKPAFSFHHKEPPLSTIRFKDHPPSNAILMELGSVFADIDGFTAYVDKAIANGEIAQAVANLIVIRAELAAVLKEDFGGRKVRYIGDCLHGVLAEGSARDSDPRETAKQVFLSAGAMRSSFDLMKSMLNGLGDLGLAIGLEYGNTPICRLGLRGDASVRVAASKATCKSENEQQRCNGLETAMGDEMYGHAPVSIRQSLGAHRKLQNVDFETAQMLLGVIPNHEEHAAVAEPNRAHGISSEPNRSYCV